MTSEEREVLVFVILRQIGFYKWSTHPSDGCFFGTTSSDEWMRCWNKSISRGEIGGDDGLLIIEFLIVYVHGYSTTGLRKNLHLMSVSYTHACDMLLTRKPLKYKYISVFYT